MPNDEADDRWREIIGCYNTPDKMVDIGREIKTKKCTQIINNTNIQK